MSACRLNKINKDRIMDLINNRTKSIAAMALDGLYERSKAIGANTVNVLTPNYQRKEVSFEKSLQDVIKREDEKENIKIQNSMMYQKNPSQVLAQSPEQIAFLNSETNPHRHSLPPLSPALQ